ncbi:MAG: hypothetical protein R3324_00605 [Halobacteriales archaeon]|nr:hypothetical protein [Halobacteriales archaeon]
MTRDHPVADAALTVGRTVYDEAGRDLGTIRGFDEDGFFVTTRDGIAALSIGHEHPSHGFGEAELLWRCSECGAIGDITELPSSCPDCGASVESIYYLTED